MQYIRMDHWNLIYWMLIAVGFALPASATAPIYRCKQDGQTVLTDKPCEGTTTTPASGATAIPPSGVVGNSSGSQSVVGDWRGQTQYQGTQNGHHMDEAHTVVPLLLTFSSDGKVSGTSPDNGCKLLGLWSPGLTSRLFPLDITLNGCSYTGFNRRYSGMMLIEANGASAQFGLQAYTPPIPGTAFRSYDVKATLWR
jgi:hypothetical protein